MADTESLISEWEESGSQARIVAADIARKIAGKSRYDELPLNSALAAQWDVSHRTVSAAKSILHDHGILILENRRYYVALPHAARLTDSSRAASPFLGPPRGKTGAAAPAPCGAYNSHLPTGSHDCPEGG